MGRPPAPHFSQPLLRHGSEAEEGKRSLGQISFEYYLFLLFLHPFDPYESLFP